MIVRFCNKFKACFRPHSCAFLLSALLLSYANAAPVQRLEADYQSINRQGSKPVDGVVELKNKRRQPPLDLNVLDKWPSLGSPQISNDGHYASYTINNLPIGSRTLVLQASAGNWKIEIPGASSAEISRDSRIAVFSKGDSLGIAELGSSLVKYVSHVKSFKISKKGEGDWLAYLLQSPINELVIDSLSTGKQIHISSVTNYLFSPHNKALLLQTETQKNGITSQQLIWLSLPDGKTTIVWQGYQASQFVFDESDMQMAFMTTEEKVGIGTHSFWYYMVGMDEPVLLTTDRLAEISTGLKLDGIRRFSNDGSRLFCDLKQVDQSNPRSNIAKLDVWHYADPKLQSLQLRDLASKSYLAVISLRDSRLLRLQQEDETAPRFSKGSDDFAVVVHRKGDHLEYGWNSASQASSYLVFTRNGERKLLKISYINASPGGKFLVGVDERQRQWVSYEIATGIIRSISQSLPVSFEDDEYDEPPPGPPELSLAAWLDNDAGVLMYDKYDIWKLDPTGRMPPVNVTNGYGRKRNIAFRLAEKYDHGDQTLARKDEIILSAFNLITKENGFYTKRLGVDGNPVFLTMGPYVYTVPLSYGAVPEFPPVKARDAAVYLVQRMSASESPNYFITADFKSFAPLSDLQPEAPYNWLTAELLTWKTFDGGTSQGILYKPENFDPTIKYPVIIHYYEKKSDRLNVYEPPTFMTGALNIPWFVSHGYVVFTPDIHYKVGMPGQSVYNSVVSAAKYLAHYPWVDPRRIGIQGHSFGGFETNYLVAHTNMFAAAMASAGVSDLISSYGSLINGASAKFYYESDQGRIGHTLWQRPDLFAINSPVLNADKVTSPLLLMNNMEDATVSFAQGVEWFTALRRLNKKVWMLQYDGQGHGLRTPNSARDFTIRVTQFFDHYLKGSLPPKWMTQGVPAKLKGVDSGLELDTSGKQP